MFYGLLIILSLSGWILLLQRRLHTALIPAFFFAATGTVLTLAGILNLLPYAAWGIVLFGAFFFVWKVTRKNEQKSTLVSLWNYLLHPATVTFLVLSIFSCITLYGRILIGYDDYSHWATIVRSMQTFQRLPNFLDAEYIEFQTYPPHAACCIYFLCNSLALDDKFYLVAQAMVKCAGIISLFVAADPAKKRSSLFFAVLCSALFFSFQRSDMLQVDALLATHTIACLSAMLVWKRKLRCHLIEIFLFGTALLLTKHSGIFFWMMVLLVFYLYDRKNSLHIKYTFHLLMVSVLVFIIWRKHAEYVFTASKYSPHAVSPGVYYLHLRQNLPGLLQTALLFLHRSLSLKTNSSILPLITIVFLDFTFPKKDTEISIIKRFQFSLFSVGFFAAYSIGLFGMYLFSMSSYELQAQEMEDYARYIIPCAMVLFAIAGYRLHALISITKKGRFQQIGIWAACLICSLCIYQHETISHFDKYWHKSTYAENFISATSALHDENNIPYHASVIVVYPDQMLSYNYDGYIGKYFFLPSSYDIMSETEYADAFTTTSPSSGTYVVNLVSATVELF